MAQDFLLIWRMRNADESAFDDFVSKYYTAVLRYCRYHSADAKEAEDITQEVFLRFFKTLSGRGCMEATVNYLYAIARNLCIDFSKQRRAEKLSTAEISETGFTNDSDRLETKLDVRKALEKLDEELYETVILYYFQELKVREIARLMNISVPLVKYRLRRARMLLRQFLEDK